MAIKNPISLCIIVKNEPLLEESLQSIKDWVSQIVIIDTGSTDNKTIDIGKKYADHWEQFTDCNDPETGLIEDFSKARNYSYSKATQPWVMWMDADDVIEHPENLEKLLKKAEPLLNKYDGFGYVFPYEYSYNENGFCICKHYRERLVHNKSAFKWTNVVHEVLIQNGNSSIIFEESDDILYKHKRQFSPKTAEPGRNYRILKKYFEQNANNPDARHLYYYGLECWNSGFVNDAIDSLTKYIDVSGWDDERAMACLKLAEIYFMQANYQKAIDWGFKTIQIKETWGEGYFVLAKGFYFLAQAGGPQQQRNWERCVYFAEAGLNLKPTKTLLFINPLERDVEIHTYFNVALSAVGRVQDALNSVNVGLKTRPNDNNLLHNKNFYEKKLAQEKFFHSLMELKAVENLSDELVKLVLTMVQNGQAHVQFNEIAPPNKEEKKQNVIVQESQKVLTEKLSSDKLDVIFFAGNGLEIWTPETIKESGIGGSELMLLQQAKELAALGHRVRVYNSCGHLAGVYEGVEYHTTEEFFNLTCDVLIISRYADMVDDKWKIQAKLKLLWVHDVYALNATHQSLMKFDRILALTNWHKQNICNIHNLHEDHVIVTRNGIYMDRFKENLFRDQFKCINSSSPDRSWPVLLEIWPEIKKQVPQASLTLGYGFKNWELVAKMQNNTDHLNLITALRNRIKELESLDVRFIDRVSQEQLANEYLTSGAWLYPTWFSETFCQKPGTLIFTKNGMKKIEDITIGDLVLTHKGRFRKVTQLIKKEYNGNIYSFKRKKDFNPITVTEEHPLYIASFHKRSDSKGNRVSNLDNKKVYWETPNNIKNKLNYLISPKMEFGNLKSIKLSDYIDHVCIDGKLSRNHNNKFYKKVNNVIDLTEDFMYMLGLFAAEGCVSSVKSHKSKKRFWYSTITFAFHQKEQIMAGKIISYFNDGKKKYVLNTNSMSVIIYNSVWATFLKNTIGTSRDKKIPNFVWDTSKELQNAFLQGMLDGDGCKIQVNGRNNKKYKTNQYTTISPSLAYGASQLLINQGIFPSIFFSKQRKNYDLLWTDMQSHVHHYSLEEGFASKITDTKIENYTGLVYNFEVDEDESYVTDRTIVHNCIGATEAQAAGLRIITSPIAALNETVADRGDLISGDWTSPDYKDAFVKATVNALQNSNNDDRKRLQEYAKENFCMVKLAKQWSEMFYSLLDELKKNPIVPYEPTGKYKLPKSQNISKKLETKPSLVKLNLGAGPNVFPYDGWINLDRANIDSYIDFLNTPNLIIDFYTDHQKKLIDYVQNKNGKIDYRIYDITKGFPHIKSNSIDLIYCGQTLEHLNVLYQTPRVLEESYRILKQGGVLRITTPDFDKLIQAYLNNKMDMFTNEQPEWYKNFDPASQLMFLMYGASGPDCTQANYEGHMFLFTKHSMKKILQMAGFKDIRFYEEPKISAHPIMQEECNDEGLSHSMIVEGIK